MKTWLKYGLIIGIPLGIIISAILVIDTYPLNQLVKPVAYSCMALIQCSGESCMLCILIGPVIALVYSFIIGALIGLVIGKIKPKK